MGLFRRRDPQAEIFAEALALIEEGLELDFVLPLYGDDAAWLRPMVETALAARAAAREEPSFYFEATLKRRVLAAAARRHREAQQSPARAPWRTAAAAAAVLTVAAGLGTVMVGVVTADTALPGDWNYAFKLANERVAYSLSRGEGRVGVQLDVTYARLREAQALARQGRVSPEDLARIEAEAEQLGELLESKPIDDAQKARLAALSEAAEDVAKSVAAARPELAPVAERTVKKVNDAVAAGLGSSTPVITPVATPSPSPSPTPEPTATPTPEPSPAEVVGSTATADAAPPSEPADDQP